MNLPSQPHWIRGMPVDDQRQALVQALEREGGSCDRAARRLEVTRMGLWRMLRDLGMLSVPAEITERARRRFQLTG